MEGFEAHPWTILVHKTSVGASRWTEIKASVAFDWRWIRTWNDVEAVKQAVISMKMPGLCCRLL